MTDNAASRTAEDILDKMHAAAANGAQDKVSWCAGYLAALRVEAEAASGPALTTADVARALIESDLIPRYMEYARLAPSMNPAETIEHVAATWAPFVLARLAPAAAEPSVYMGCHIGWPHEHEAPAAAEPAEALRCDCVVIKRPHVLADHWVPEP